MRATRTNHLTRKRRQWWVRMAVPADVRDAFGERKWLLMSLHETDERKAEAKAPNIVKGWKDQIVAARQTRQNPAQAEANRLAAEYAKYRGKPLDDAGAALAAGILAWLFTKHGGMTAAYTALAGAKFDLPAAVRENLPTSTPAIWQGVPEAATPLLAFFEAWKVGARDLTSKTRDQYIASIQRFATANVGATIEGLTAEVVQAWIDVRLSEKVNGLPLNPDTVRRDLAGLRNYWKWLQDNKKVLLDRNPFRGRAYRDGMSKVERKEREKTRFPIPDVPKLWQAASTPNLAAAIKLAVYMGWRLSELGDLRAENVRVDPETGVRHIHGGRKSEAGIRDIPIPPDVEALVDELVATSKERGGYLLAGTDTKYHQRLKYTGELFSELKTCLGYGRRHSFHSLRHTYCYMLARAKLPRHVVKTLMGHENGDVTDGYAGKAGLDECRDALIEAMKFSQPARTPRTD